MKKLVFILSVFMMACAIQAKKGPLSRNWISNAYLKCLENELPCDCKSVVSHVFISIDTIKMEALVCDGNCYDPSRFNLRKLGPGKYEAFFTQYITDRYKDSDIVVGTIDAQKDSLFFTDSGFIFPAGRRTSLVNCYDTSEGRWMLYGKNVSGINEGFKKRGYPLLENILGRDSLSCDCNPELGGKLNTLADCDKTWLLEERNDSLFIYEWTNIDEPRYAIDLWEQVRNNKIERRLVKAYKWKRLP